MDTSLSRNHHDELGRAIHFGRANLQDWIVVEELAKAPLKRQIGRPGVMRSMQGAAQFRR